MIVFSIYFNGEGRGNWRESACGFSPVKEEGNGDVQPREIKSPPVRERTTTKGDAPVASAPRIQDYVFSSSSLV